ncbi:MAG: PEP-CTERM sorting domain-containing protein [Planctomycetaceae bacterium]
MSERLMKVLLVCVLPLTLMCTPLYAAMVFIPLGDLPGAFGTTDFYSVAHGVSNDGSTVVGMSASGNGQEAFRWTTSLGMVGLGFLPTTGSSYASDVSADGSVIVGQSGSEAFRWTSGGMTGLGDLPGGVFESRASGISADGTVIVGASKSGNGQEAFRWTSADGMAGLGDLSGGIFSSAAEGISDDGNIITGISTADFNNQRGFTWTSSGSMVNIGALPGGNESFAYAVADSGDVVGYGHISFSPQIGFLNLDILPHGGLLPTTAWDLSGNAGIVVGYATVGGNHEAVLWTALEGMQSIRDLLIADSNDMTGWHLSEATAISSNGRYIAGFGTNPDGKTEAWLISDLQSVPEPSSFVLLLGMTALLAGSSRYRRRKV